MDVSYIYFRRLMAHWHASHTASDAFDRDADIRQSDGERHARRLIAKCGRCWESNGLAAEDD